MSYIFVDCEADFKSPCPGLGNGMTEFGAVELDTKKTFHGKPRERANGREAIASEWLETMLEFEAWVKGFKGPPIFWSDNPAYDWQWINYYFWHTIHRNPFGHSARRIGDFYAGLVGDLRAASDWKQLRITPHDHNPVNDAMGNVEAFVRILNKWETNKKGGER